MYILLKNTVHLLSHPMLYSNKVWWTFCGLKVLPVGKEADLKRATCKECDKWEKLRASYHGSLRDDGSYI